MAGGVQSNFGGGQVQNNISATPNQAVEAVRFDAESILQDDKFRSNGSHQRPRRDRPDVLGEEGFKSVPVIVLPFSFWRDYESLE